MDIQALWDKARQGTEILRMRLPELSSFDATAVPYIFLAESAIHRGDTVVRRGQVVIEQPAILLPHLSPQFEGFDFERELQISEDLMTTFLLVRGIQFPSLKYKHQVSSLDVLEQSLDQSVGRYREQLARAEDIQTGLVTGPEEAWQFSLLLLVGAMVVKSAHGDLRRLLEQWRRRLRDN